MGVFGIRAVYRKIGDLIPMDIGRVLKNMAGYGLQMNRGVGLRFIMVAGLGMTGTVGFGYLDILGLLRGYFGGQVVVIVRGLLCHQMRCGDLMSV